MSVGVYVKVEVGVGVHVGPGVRSPHNAKLILAIFAT